MTSHGAVPDSLFDRGGSDQPPVSSTARLSEFVECLTGVDSKVNMATLRAWRDDDNVSEPLEAVANTIIDLRDNGRRGMGAPRYLEPERNFEPVIDLTGPEAVIDDRFRRKDRAAGKSPRGVSDRPTGRTSEGFVPV